MKIVLVGTGTIGGAVKKTLESNGHTVVTVGRR